MPWIIRIICFVLTTAIFIPIESALAAANTATPLIWLITAVIYLFIFYIPSNALIAMWEKKRDSAHDSDLTTDHESIWSKLLSALIIALVALLGQLPFLFIAIIPFFMIKLSSLLVVVLAFVAYLFPITTIIFWIWGIVCVFQRGWGVWPVVYCILFIVLFIPQYLGILFRKPNKADQLY